MNALKSAAACALGALTISALLAGLPAAAQTPKEIQAALDAAHAKYKDIAEGANADYIPALAKVDSKIYGIALVTTDGKVYTAGDVASAVEPDPAPGPTRNSVSRPSSLTRGSPAPVPVGFTTGCGKTPVK